jgi:ADP-dependent NAD(P)H-hydrate dehydratase / NAD(P)H-hydrate epimerase
MKQGMDNTSLDKLRGVLERRPDSHKYDYGHVLVVGGSPGMVGAPLLVAMAALRIGAGLVTIASSADIIDKLENGVLEVMTLRLPKDGQAAAERLGKFIDERKVNVVAAGSGLADDNVVRLVLPRLRVPAVLDAGALSAHDTHQADVVLTPHAGELSRLISEDLPQDRKKLLQDKAREWKVTLLLKGDHTIVAGGEGQFYVNDTGNPGLATAGTGDVLSGVIAGLLAQGLGSFEAAKYGVYLHGLAGDLAAADKTQPGLIASDVIEYLPAALNVSNIT